jgi:hypothetical protein
MEFFGLYLKTKTEIAEKCIVALIEKKIIEFDISIS